MRGPVRLLAVVATSLALWLAVGPTHTHASDVEICDKGDIDQAIAACTRLIEAARSPDRSTSHLNRGLLYAAKGEHEKAIADYTASIALGARGSKAFTYRGYSYLELDRHDEAVADLNKAISINSKDDTAFRYRGMVHAEKGLRDLAISDFTAAIRLSPTNEKAFYSRGNVHLDAGDCVKAIADFTKALSIKRTYESFTNRAACHFNGKDYDKAIADHTEALRIDPSAGGSFLRRGRAYAAKGNFAAAIGDFERVTADNASKDTVLIAQAKLADLKGEREKAITMYNAVLRLNDLDDELKAEVTERLKKLTQ